MNTELQTSAYTEIASLLRQGLDSFRRAGELIVAQVDSGDTVANIAQKSGVPVLIVSRLEQVGRDSMIPELLLAGYSSANALRKLPYSEQARLQSEAVEVLVVSTDGPTTLQIDTKALTPAQVAQVFGSGCVRSLAEQRAWLASKETKAAPAHGDYVLGKNCIVIPPSKESRTFSRQSLARILAELS